MYGHFIGHRLLRTRLIFLYLIAFTLLTFGKSEAALTNDEQKLLSGVDVSRLMHAIEHLCGDQYNGRRAGSPEELKAADYLASQYSECGLSALNMPGINEYEQPLTMKYSQACSAVGKETATSARLIMQVRTKLRLLARKRAARPRRTDRLSARMWIKNVVSAIICVHRSVFRVPFGGV